ncbi:MAG: HEAT repeat domain-containing protein [Elusimicrobia bacterium]|nr:HEAT repeat domain-containing protein [Elusimicrobiota bacterium]
MSLQLAAILKCDLAGSTELSRLLPQEEKAGGMREVYNAVEFAVDSYGGRLGEWGGDGVAAYFYNEEPALSAVRAAVDAIGRVRLIYKPDNLSFRFELRAAVGVDFADISEPAKTNPDNWNLAGHLEKANVCPRSGVCVTEDVYFDLQQSDPELAEKFSYLGMTTQDNAPVFVHPRGASPADPGGLRDVPRDYYPAITKVRAYFCKPPFSLLRFYTLPQFNFMGTLELLRVFVPLNLRLRRPFEQPAPADKDLKNKAKEARFRPEGVESRPETFPDALKKNRSLIILGGPGAGKTTLLRYTAIAASQGKPGLRRRLGLDEALFPLYANAAELLKLRRKHSEKSLLEVFSRLYAARTEQEASAGVIMTGLSEMTKAGKIIFLIDSMDEMAKSDDRQAAAQLVEEIAGSFGKCRFIVASRLTGYPGINIPGSQEYALEPLNTGQAEKLAVEFYTEVLRSSKCDELYSAREGQKKGEELVSRLAQSAGMALFTENPLLITLAALVHLQLGELPRYRAKLYEVAVETLVSAWAKARTPLAADSASPLRTIDYQTEGLAVLPELAFFMQENCPGNLIQGEDLLGFISKRLPKSNPRPAEDFLKRLNNAGSILVEKGAGQWGFLHQTFQEYLAAFYLAKEDSFEEKLLNRIYHPRWEEVIRFTAGVLSVVQKRDSAAGKFIDRIFSNTRDWRATKLNMNKYLAAKCAADVVSLNPDIENKIMKFIYDVISRAAGIPELPELCATTFSALANTPLAGKLIPNIIKLLQDKDDWVRASSAKALGRLGAKEAVPQLIKLLQDKDDWVRARSAEALGRLGAKEAVPQLIKLLQDKDDWMRARSAEALGRLGAKEVQPKRF